MTLEIAKIIITKRPQFSIWNTFLVTQPTPRVRAQIYNGSYQDNAFLRNCLTTSKDVDDVPSGQFSSLTKES